MAAIRLLDSDTINRIAAGEVVERPASVVKELVENAIDAQATAVSVEIREGGIRFIRITDNGKGIPREEVPIAFSRHATSKIRTAEDLLSVSSLGFRGEALSSIAAVARVELFTKTAEDLSGVHYLIEGGEEKLMEPAGMPAGTTFVVRNLFYNTPARRKFLKSQAAEAGQIQELMVQFALSHPEISFRLTSQNQVKLQTSGRHKLKEIIYEVCGREIAGQLLELDGTAGDLEVSGYLGKPLIGRGNRSFEHYFINGRYIKSKVVTDAIEDAYQGFLMQHRYPFAVLHIRMPAEQLDVNVHPSKMELRFRDGRAVYEQLKELIAERLKKEQLIDTFGAYEIEKVPVSYVKDHDEKAGFPKESPVCEETKQSREPMPSMTPMPEPVEKKSLEAYQQRIQQQLSHDRGLEKERQEEQLRLFDDRIFSKKAAGELKLIGQVFSTYWIVEYENKMYIIDQHAAHEKVIYERMQKDLSRKQMTSQQVSPPVVLTLSGAEETKLLQYLPYFEKLGYEISSFGGAEYMITAVPGNLYGLGDRDLFLQLLDQLDTDTGRNQETAILEKLASMSCKAAVKGGMNLTEKEARALFEELLQLDNPYHCPHGRPVIIAMTRQELEKKFRRIL